MLVVSPVSLVLDWHIGNEIGTLQVVITSITSVSATCLI